MKKLIFYFILLIYLFNYNVVYANNIVHNQNIDIIKEKFENNQTVYINLNNNDKLIAKRKILDLIKDKNKTLIYNIKDNNKIFIHINLMVNILINHIMILT